MSSNVFKTAQELKNKLGKDLIELSHHKASEMLYDLAGKLKYKALKSENKEKGEKLNKAAMLIDKAIEVLRSI